MVVVLALQSIMRVVMLLRAVVEIRHDYLRIKEERHFENNYGERMVKEGEVKVFAAKLGISNWEEGRSGGRGLCC
jgi:hypothetical protein